MSETLTHQQFGREELQHWLRFIRGERHIVHKLLDFMFQQAANQQAHSRNTGSWAATVESLNNSSSPKLTGCDYSPDGSAFAISNEKGVLEVFDARTQTSLWCVQADPKKVWHCAWSPAGYQIASCGTEGAKIWDVVTGNLMGTLEGTEKSARIVFSPDSRRLAAHSSSSVLIFDVETCGQVSSIAALGSTHLEGSTRSEIAWSSDGLALLVGDCDLTVVVIDPSAPQALGRLAGHKGVKFASTYFGQFGQDAEVLCAFTSKRRFAVTAHIDGLIRVWDVFEEKLLARFATDSAFRCMAASGERLSLGDDQGYLHWFSIENLPHEAEAPTPRSDVCDQCAT
ncbi:MAG: hypothetical protein AABN33_21850 [Acidobacteriota bacterium]